METALVFNREGTALIWHTPHGRTQGSIPDSRFLWDMLWTFRHQLGGVAHTHPWDGHAAPSRTDVTTFRAIEVGLGRLLLWPIVTFTEVRWYGYDPYTGDYGEVGETVTAPLAANLDVDGLRALSR